MGFIDGLFNAVKSKYERDMSSYRDGYSSGSSKFVNERFRAYAQSEK